MLFSAVREMDISEVIARIHGGDAGAEAELMARLARPVRLMAQARTRDGEVARDLTQDSLLAVLIAIREGRIRDPEAAIPFVMGVARNIVNSWIRSRVRMPRASTLDEDAEELCVQSAGLEQRLEVKQALAKLGEMDRRVLIHVLIDGMDATEAAAALGTSAENVRQRKSRALRKLLMHMGPHGQCKAGQRPQRL